MASKKELRKRIGELEEQLAQTSRQAHFAEVVCYWAGQLLDPANVRVADNRRERLETAYRRWKKEVPIMPFRGLFWPEVPVIEWLQPEFQDSEGYWHFLVPQGNKEA